MHFVMPIFTTKGATYPNVMHTVDSDVLRSLKWQLTRPNRTHSHGEIKGWKNSRVEGVAGVQWLYIGY